MGSQRLAEVQATERGVPRNESRRLSELGDAFQRNDLGQLTSPQINYQRLWDDIQFTAQWGTGRHSEGMHRLALSQDDKAVREWFIQETTALGCTTLVDAMGNLFAIYPGGRYDGVLGVLAAVEVIRTIQEAGVKTVYPIAAIVWTNEEGAAFFPGCSGSSVWAGWVPLTDAYQQKHLVTGQSLEAALDEINAKGNVASSSHANPLQVHFELHIEQGNLLHTSQQSIGVVRRIQGIRRYKISCYGRQDHAGTVCVEDRADALIAASKLILRIEELALACGAYATVGVLQIENPSPNTIPSHVTLTVDAWHSGESTLDELEREIFDFLTKLTSLKPDWTFTQKKVWHSPALTFDAELTGCIASAAAAAYGAYQVRDMMSLAGHDSAMTALAVPTAMIFVPSRDGISHSPLENTSLKHWFVGVS